MPALATQLTLAQQRKMLPKQIPAIGQFDVHIDSVSEHYQTKTVQHHFDLAVLRVTGRHADHDVTIKKIFIQVPDTTRPGIIDLARQQDTDVDVWYSVDEPGQQPFAVQCISGTLEIHSISMGRIAIKATLDAHSENGPSGAPFHIKVELDLSI